MKKSKKSMMEAGVEIGKKVYEDGLQPAVKQAGGILSTFTGFFNNVVLFPLKKLNIVFEQKALAFEREVQAKYNNIPEENRVEPPINIIGPALESLKYNIDQDNIREMFVNLLTNSMDNRVSKFVHPKYVKIIEDMSNNDAILFKHLFENIAKNIIICCPRVILEKDKKHYVSTGLPQYLTNVELDSLNEQDVSFALNSLHSLGLIELSFVEFQDHKDYASLINNNELCQTILKRYQELTPERDDVKLDVGTIGIVKVTDVGKYFGKICL